MKTLILKEKDLKTAADLLNQGKLVVFPTETVYGLGANALDPKAIKKIFAAKQRPADNPLIVHISSINQVKPLVKSIPKIAKKLMKQFWPGPLSIVFEKSSKVPKETTAGLDTVVIRMPSHPIAKKLISLSKIPIAAPSANRSGKPSPTNAKHVLEDMSGRVDAILDGGSCKKGLESTVIDVRTKPFIILRQGSITLEQLNKAIGQTEIANSKTKVSAPGMKYRHYAPEAKLILVKGPKEKVDKKIIELKKKYKNAIVFKRDHLKANELFHLLRSKKKGIIICPSVPEKGIGRTVMDRLNRAASKIIIAE